MTKHDRPTCRDGPRRWLSIGLLVATFTATGCGTERQTPGPSPGELRAASTVVGSFVDQIDGAWGYEAIRPALWAPGSGPGRAFYSTSSDGKGRIILVVKNLSAVPHEPSTDAQWELFPGRRHLQGGPLDSSGR